MEYLRLTWARSKIFRIILIIASIYVVLRIGAHFFYYAIILPESTGRAGIVVPVDLQVYLDAAERFLLRQNLYPEGKLPEDLLGYEYPPFYAIVSTPFLWIPTDWLVILYTLLHLVGFGMLYTSWDRIFCQLGLSQARERLSLCLPIWLVFSAFWNDITYLNNYTFMALLATLLIESVVNEHLGRSLLWLSIILQIKPQWAFAAALPLFLRRWRFFSKLLISATAVYLAITGITVALAGFAYSWQQYRSYFLQIWNYTDIFPWQGPGAQYLGYHHSIVQTAFYLFGVTPTVRQVVVGIKLALLAPLMVLLFWPTHRIERDDPQQSLGLAFALYLGTFIWLDVIAELTLGIVVFIYLLVKVKQRGLNILLWITFLIYALSDFCEFVSIAVFGDQIIAHAKPVDVVITNPNIYIPTIMIVILTFYALLLKQLWCKTNQFPDQKSF